MGAGHGHAGQPALPSSPAVRRTVVALLVPLVLATLAGLALLWPRGELPSTPGTDRVSGTVLAIRDCSAEPAVTGPESGPATGQEPGQDDGGDPLDRLPGAAPAECAEATVRVESGADAGATVTVPLPYGPGAPEVGAGDRIVLGGLPEVPLESRYEFLEFHRATPLLVLSVLFAAAVVGLSRWRGLAALAGLGISVLVLATFVVPALLAGRPALAVAVVGAATIMVSTLYLAHGVSVRTSVALLGTLVSLALTGLLGAVFTALSRFSGYHDESLNYLTAVDTGLDIGGLLLAGLVIGALGVLDDVTITQVAAVWEVARAAPEASRRSLIAAGMRVGRDHVASTVNTLVLAYAGAALPVLMLFALADQGAADLLGTEIVSQEVVRALVGSLGIVAAVPVTTVLAALAVRERPRHRAG